jgi:hypothetical protein
MPLPVDLRHCSNSVLAFTLSIAKHRDVPNDYEEAQSLMREAGREQHHAESKSRAIKISVNRQELHDRT